MTVTDAALLAGAAFLAGVLNTVAGGGTFLTFPALVYAGLPPVAANATSAVAVFPGYIAGALGFAREISAFDRRRLAEIGAITAVGGLIGSLLLLASSNRAFRAIVPVLLAFATLSFAFGERLERWLPSGRAEGRPSRLGLLLVAIYGGYFNGGLGIVLLALFSLSGMRDLNLMNGLKNGLSFILSPTPSSLFAAACIVAAVGRHDDGGGSASGGYVGAPLARRRLPARHRRGAGGVDRRAPERGVFRPLSGE